jgi:pimeloyl-ACP methyl ester carboxylesterase
MRWLHSPSRLYGRTAVQLPALLAIAVLVAALVGCSGSPDPSRDDSGEASVDPAAREPSTTSSTSPEVTGDHYDVGGHELYMECAGEGPITVVFVHGWVNDPSFVPHDAVEGVRDLLTDDYRLCSYDRRNVGSSDTVDAVQTPKDMVRDMHAVLDAGGVEPPYILYAGSFGGLVAHAYLKEHAEEVVGMVLVDSMFPDELKLDRYLPREYTFKHFSKEDKCCTVERVSQYDLIRSLQSTIGKEPDIPAVYLASEQEPRNENDYESPEYDARILDAQAAYVDRFSPGILRWVDAPHFMEPVVPDVVADAIREVGELATATD